MTKYPATGFETKFFTHHHGYDELDSMTLIFYDCELVPVLSSQVGVSVAAEVVVSFEDMYLQIRANESDEDVVEWSLDVHLGELQ